MKAAFRLLIVLALFALAACNADRQPPLPYAVMPRDANLLPLITRQAGVEIMPPEGIAAGSGAALAGALAVALQEHDIAAASGHKLAGGQLIKGVVRREPGAIIIAWALSGADGAELAKFEARDALPANADPGEPLDPGVAQALAVRAAAAFAPYFPAASGPQSAVPALFVADIAAAPGDGGAALPLALRNALRAAGMRVAEQNGPQAIRIEGEVHLSELDAASQLVKLSWRVLAPDGAEIGRIDQSNPVFSGQLDSHWGPVAYEAAAGAAEGIIPLLQDYQAQTAGEK